MRAFCPLLWAQNGGRFKENSTTPDLTGPKVKGKCDNASDCGECSILWRYVGSMTTQGWKVSWECHECIKATKLQAKREELQIEFVLPGYFQSSKYDADGNVVEPSSMFDGCYQCGFGTPFLQVVFRRGEDLKALTAKRGD